MWDRLNGDQKEGLVNTASKNQLSRVLPMVVYTGIVIGVYTHTHSIVQYQWWRKHANCGG